MSFITAAIVGGAIAAGGSIYASSQASSAALSGTKKGIKEQQRQYDTTMQMLEPQRYLGYQAMGDLANLYGYGMSGYQPYRLFSAETAGIPAGRGLLANVPQAISSAARRAIRTSATGGATGASAPGEPGDMSRFFTSPDYQFRMNEGMDAIKNLASVRGGIGGNVMREGANYASGLAAGEFDRYVSRLMQLAGFGTTATAQGAQAGQATANNVSNMYADAGNARASSYMAGAAGVNSAIQGGLQNYMFQQYLNQQPSAPPTAPQAPGNTFSGGWA